MILSIGAQPATFKKQTKHVAAFIDPFEDAGSIPATSTKNISLIHRGERQIATINQNDRGYFYVLLF